ncbi:MAG: AarF/ABC1/UbiB kinase family protein [Gemmatimonadaceae bacterium]|nr:AarF/ABC1/UbiB kinase family protein [Gemmatimonadaceae bacterium]
MRDWLRLGVILARVVPLAVSFRRDYRRWIRWGGPVPRSAEFHAARARAVVRGLAELGPTFVKLAQIFSTRADLVAEPYLGALSTLTDQVPPVAWPALRATLERAWGVDPDTVLDALDPVPLAAGSLGQVHRARHLGREVVVKILRPGVEAIVARDVRLARRLVDWMYARFPHHHVLGFRVVLNEFAVHVREEMDFVREGAQCTRMRARFADEPRLRIPEVITELTRHEVLVLEYLPGTRIDALEARIADGSVSALTLVETLIECYARMMLRDGVFHADPHPGNLLVDANGRIILLDFGMVIDVDVTTRKALFDTIIAAVRRDAVATSNGFFALGMVAPGTSPETMQALVAVLLDIAFSESDIAERTRMLAERVMRELFSWPVVLPGELVYFARTAVLIEAVGARYDASFNSIRVASPVVLRLRRELLVALIGDADASDPIVRWAATLGAVAGGAVALLGTARERWASEATQTWTKWREALAAPTQNAPRRPEITEGRS